MKAKWFFRATLTHLTRPCFKVIFHHPDFKDIGGVADYRGDGDWFAATDVAVQPLHTVQAQRSRNPEPGLRENKNIVPQRLLAFCLLFSQLHECFQDLTSHLTSTPLSTCRNPRMFWSLNQSNQQHHPQAPAISIIKLIRKKMLIMSFATMLFWFDVVRLQLVSAMKETYTDQSTIQLINMYGKMLSDFQYYLTITFL